VLIVAFCALAQPGQPPLQPPPGLIVSEFCLQAGHPPTVIPGQPARQQLPVPGNEFAAFIAAVILASGLRRHAL
jgi:hypothetical protein